MITDSYKRDHCRGELGRGKIERCPRSWLRVARRVAMADGDLDLAEACKLALVDWPKGEGDNRAIRKLAGRRLI